jgi:hypothetical protein
MIHFAERASIRLLQLYRDHGKLQKMTTEHVRAATAFKSLSEIASSPLSVGTFYSVFYLGQGVPPALRSREYIYRSASNLHVSEFQRIIRVHLQVTSPTSGVEVQFLSIHQLVDMAAFEASKNAFVVMTAVKPGGWVVGYLRECFILFGCVSL